MKKFRGVQHCIIVCPILLSLTFSMTAQPAAAQSEDGYVFLVREIELSELELEGPVGLGYSPQADVLLAVQGKPGQPDRTIAMLNRIERQVGSAELDEPPADPINMAFNQKYNSLYLFEPGDQALVQVPADSSGKLPPEAKATNRYDMRGLGVQNARGIDFHPADGRLFFLDPAGKRLYIITPDAAGDYSVEKSKREGRARQVDLKGVGEKHLNGLAINPLTGHLFTLGIDSKTLYEITENGDLVESRDVSAFELQDPQSMVFAPSGDATDQPEINSLYLADPQRDMIAEVSITPNAAAALPSPSSISLVNTILTSSWNPPSPDPVGIEYHPGRNSLFVVDSEVDEMSIFQGKNVYESSLTGGLGSTCSTIGFPSREPNGLGVNPNNGHIFISDDGKDSVYEIDLGPDGQICTGDDQVRSFSTMTFGISDPEGVAYGNGSLFVTDGLNVEVYVISPGANGVFDGGPPDGDDQATHFDTAVMGLRDPEGVGFHPVNGTVILVSRPDKIMVEASLSGEVRRVFDIAFLNAKGPGGVGVGPGSQNPSAINVYMAARGVDNNTDPNENDGKIYELNIGDTGGPPPTPTTPTPTETPSATPTPTPTQTPPPPGSVMLYLSLDSNGSGDLSFAYDEDILQYDGGGYSLFFDGSDVGISTDLKAINVVDSDTILMSFSNALSIPGIGTVDDHDIVEFTATSLGSNTAGTFQLFFNGEDVGLTTSSEDIDAFDLLPDGRLVISTTGGVSVTGVSGVDEDLLVFTPTQLGGTTSGTWAMYFDGSDVGLSTNSGEDVDGVQVINGQIYLSTLGNFAVSGVSGTGADIFVCQPSSLGSNTSCNFSSTLFFQGSASGITGNNVDGFNIP